jgi:hypothetical protein
MVKTSTAQIKEAVARTWAATTQAPAAVARPSAATANGFLRLRRAFHRMHSRRQRLRRAKLRERPLFCDGGRSGVDDGRRQRFGRARIDFIFCSSSVPALPTTFA